MRISGVEFEAVRPHSSPISLSDRERDGPDSSARARISESLSHCAGGARRVQRVRSLEQVPQLHWTVCFRICILVRRNEI